MASKPEPELTPEQAERIKRRVMAYADRLYRERMQLLYFRARFARTRAERGNRLPDWDWPREDDAAS